MVLVGAVERFDDLEGAVAQAVVLAALLDLGSAFALPDFVLDEALRAVKA